MIISCSDIDQPSYLTAVNAVVRNMRQLDVDEAECCFPTWWIDGGLIEYLIYSASTFQDGSYLCINEEGEPVAVGGIAHAHLGCSNAWLWSTDEFNSYKLEMIRFMKKRINQYFNEKQGHRIQCLTAGFHSNSIEWLESLGFTKEGELIKFGSNGESFYQFGITR